jgi:hypothetical protein
VTSACSYCIKYFLKHKYFWFEIHSMQLTGLAQMWRRVPHTKQWMFVWTWFLKSCLSDMWPCLPSKILRHYAFVESFPWSVECEAVDSSGKITYNEISCVELVYHWQVHTGTYFNNISRHKDGLTAETYWVRNKCLFKTVLIFIVMCCI